MSYWFLFAVAAVVWEIVSILHTKRRPYQRESLLSNLGCGLLRGATELLLRGVILLAFTLVYNLSPLKDIWPNGSILGWLGAFVAYDFFYYWGHRLSHRIAFLWASHQVHHEPRQFNLAIGFRQSVFGSIFGFPFILPLALLGVSPEVFVALTIVRAALIFWLHSAHRFSRGPLFLLLNSPGHHAMHHSRETRHHDKNFGGILLVWDRLFGTYTPAEADTPLGMEETPVANPIMANIRPWQTLGKKMTEAKSWASKAIVFWGTPDADPTPKLAEGDGGLLVKGVVLVALASGIAVALRMPPLFLLLSVPAALLVLDFLSGLVHWFLDHHVAPSETLLGRMAYDFQDHHVRPMRTTKVGFFTSAYRVGFISFPLLGIAYVAGASFVGALLTTTAVLALFAPQVHKWSHLKSPSPAIRLFQRSGILMSKRSHAVHHGKGQDKAYCIVTGWCNAPLDSLGFWSFMDRLMEVRNSLSQPFLRDSFWQIATKRKASQSLHSCL